MKAISICSARAMIAGAAVFGTCAASGDDLTLDVQEGSQTFSADISAGNLNKTGAGEAVVNASSIVVSGRATSSAGVLKFTGSGTRTFGSLMAADGKMEFDDAVEEGWRDGVFRRQHRNGRSRRCCRRQAVWRDESSYGRNRDGAA